MHISAWKDIANNIKWFARERLVSTIVLFLIITKQYIYNVFKNLI